MCGLIGGQITYDTLMLGVGLLTHRGPDDAGWAYADGWFLGHTRLAVQDLSEESHQPYVSGGTRLTYNGELWHPSLLAAFHHIARETTGDTEIVAKMLDLYGVGALPMLDGMWALAWVDPAGRLFLARDTYGEVPLHYGFTRDGGFVYSSEVGPLLAVGAEPSTVRWVEPGTVIDVAAMQATRWGDPLLPPSRDDTDVAATRLGGLLADAVEARSRSDVPVAALLSGGLDSSAIVGLLVEQGVRPAIYTAVYNPRSADLRHTRAIASHFDLDVHEVFVPEPDGATLARMVRTIEMPHKAQVEIALGCDALGAAMRSDGIGVVLSGEGSDELWASYGMDYHGVQRKGWFNYRADTFATQHRKNFARTNKVFMRHSIEARMPFLHPPLVRYALSLSQDCVTGSDSHPKAVLAQAVSLPKETAYRSKVAFQTGAGLDTAAASAVFDPRAFYAAEFHNAFKGVTP